MSATVLDVVKLHARRAGLLFCCHRAHQGSSATSCPLFRGTYEYITRQLVGVGSATDKTFDDCCRHAGAPLSVERVADRAIQDARDKAQAGSWGFCDRQADAVVTAFSAVRGDVLHSLYQAYGFDPSQAYAFAAQDYEDFTQPLLQKAEDRLQSLMKQYGVKHLKLPSHFIQGTADVRVFNNAANAVASTVVNVFLPPGHVGLSSQSGAPLGSNHSQCAANSSQNQAGPSNHGGEAPGMNHPRHESPSRHIRRSIAHSSQIYAVSKPASVHTPAPAAPIKPQKSSAPQAATLKQSTHHGSAPAEVKKLLLSKVKEPWVRTLYQQVNGTKGARLGKETAFNEVWEQKKHDLKAVLNAQLKPELQTLHYTLYQLQNSPDSRRKESLVQHIIEWFDKNC